VELNINILLRTLKNAARIILENGGETYRAEETILYICNSFEILDAEVFSTPTGLIFTADINNKTLTLVCRIKKRGINLSKINSAIEISRGMVSNKITLEEADKALIEIRNTPDKNFLFTTLATGISSGFFSLLFGGAIIDFFVAMFSGIVVALISILFRKQDMFQFIISFIAGAVTALFAVLCLYVFNIGSIDKIIAGGIMPFLPGLAATNAIRDTMRGDLVSGNSRFSEALLVAISIAAGAGIVLKLYAVLGGNIVL